MSPIRGQTLICCSNVWMSHFAIRPQPLFADIMQRNTVVITQMGKEQNPKLFSTNYSRWNAAERDFLFRRLWFTEVTDFLGGDDISTLSVQWLEWGAVNGSLSNGGEKPEIQLPGDVDELLTRYYIRVDRISYDDTVPWPVSADGTGSSLDRISDGLYGNDVVNWQAVSPNPGK